MTALFSQVAELFTRRQQKKVEDRHTLVALILDGKKGPTPAQIATALDELGWDPEGLEKEVARRQQRRQDAAALAEVPSLEKEKADLEGKGREEVSRFEAAIKPMQEEHRQKIDALNGRFFYVTNRIPQAEAMKARLLQTYAGPLSGELDENRSKQAELNREIHKTLKAAEKLEYESQFVRKPNEFVEVVREAGQVLGVVATTTSWTKMTPTEAAFAATEDAFAGLTPEESEAKKAAAKSLRETAAKAQTELDALVKREAEILELMLVP